MSDTKKVAVSPAAVATVAAIMREATEAQVRHLERQLLIQVNENMQMQKALAEKDQIIQRLEHIRGEREGGRDAD